MSAAARLFTTGQMSQCGHDTEEHERCVTFPQHSPPFGVCTVKLP